MSDRNEVKTRARRKGRRIVMTIYFVVIVLICLVPLYQITKQAFYLGEPLPKGGLPSCREGIDQLYGAVLRARHRCATLDLPEHEAVELFRRTLGPAWKDIRLVEKACETDPQGARAFDAVKVLRYSEETAVRYDAVRISRVRKRAKERVKAYLSSQPEPSGAKTSLDYETN